MQTFAGDVRFALRGLRRSPLFTAVAVLTLALGIGATTTIFSVLEAVLLRPWPFAEPAQLVVPVTQDETTGAQWSAVNWADWEDWTAAGVFESAALYMRSSSDMAAPGGDAERVRTMYATAELYGTLGIEAALGRLPLPADHQDGAGRVVVLSNALWRSRFAAERSVVGSVIRLSGYETTVIGVLPPAADVLDAGLFVPIRPGPEAYETYRDRDNFAFFGFARIADGRDVEATRTALKTVAERIASEHAALREGTSSDIVPLAEWVVGEDLSQILWVALGAVALVLIIGCANLANLLLARGMRRERELAVRAALGAGRGRLVSQLLIESAMLALLGGAAGVLVASVATGPVVARAALDVPRIEGAGINVRVLGFSLALALASAAAFGLLPAFRSTTTGARTLSDRGAGDGGLRGRRWRSGLVVVEVALTVVLLAGAGVMLRSLAALIGVDPHFDTENVVAFNVSLPSSRYPEVADVQGGFDRLRESIEAMPGVDGVALASQLPLGATGGYLNRAYLRAGVADPREGLELVGPWQVVTPGYFAVMRQAVLRGREFASFDDRESTPVMIVNREFARLMFGDEASALGERVRSWRDEDLEREIVGVVEDVPYFGAGDELRPVVYIPLQQERRSALSLVVRTTSEPAAFVPSLRAAVRAFDPDLATAGFLTMREAFHRSIADRRFAASLLGVFALLALTLAALGLYGVLSISVAHRTREFGVRMALGAHASDVRRMVLRQAALLVGAGGALGIVAALALTRVLSTVLFDVQATDPATFAAVVALLLAVGMLASWLPAARATRADPLLAIRAQ